MTTPTVEDLGQGEHLAVGAHAIRRALAESVWAIRPETLGEIAAVLRGEAPATPASSEELLAAAQARMPGVQTGVGSTAVIPVRGVIKPRLTLFELFFGGGTTIQGLRRALRTVAADSAVSSIVLDIDSPGGMVDGIPELAAEIREVRRRKPVVAVANTVAASAAYWLASQADEVLVTPSGSIGSIGVYVVHQDWSGFDAKMGVDFTLISAGKYKTEGNSFEPLSDEARDALQARVDEIYGMFVGDVARGRKVKVGEVRGGYGEGRVLLAKPAVAEGIADAVGTVDDAIERAARLASSGSRRGARAEQLQPDEIAALAQAGERGAAAGRGLAALLEQATRREDDPGDTAMAAATELARALDAMGVEVDQDSLVASTRELVESHAAVAAIEDGDEVMPPASAESDAEDDDWAADLAATSPSFRAALARSQP